MRSSEASPKTSPKVILDVLLRLCMPASPDAPLVNLTKGDI